MPSCIWSLLCLPCWGNGPILRRDFSSCSREPKESHLVQCSMMGSTAFPDLGGNTTSIRVFSEFIFKKWLFIHILMLVAATSSLWPIRRGLIFDHVQGPGTCLDWSFLYNFLFKHTAHLKATSGPQTHFILTKHIITFLIRPNMMFLRCIFTELPLYWCTDPAPARLCHFYGPKSLRLGFRDSVLSLPFGRYPWKLL